MSSLRNLSTGDKRLIRQCLHHLRVESRRNTEKVASKTGTPLNSKHRLQGVGGGVCSVRKSPQETVIKGVLAKPKTSHTGIQFECDTATTRCVFCLPGPTQQNCKNTQLTTSTGIQLGYQQNSCLIRGNTNLTHHKNSTKGVLNRRSIANYHTSSQKHSAPFLEGHVTHIQDGGSDVIINDDGIQSAGTRHNDGIFARIQNYFTAKGHTTTCKYATNKGRLSACSFKDPYSSGMEQSNISACPFHAILGKGKTKDSTPPQEVKQCSANHGSTSQTKDDGLLPMSEIPGPQSLPYIGTMHKYVPYLGEFSNKDSIARDTKKLAKYGEIVREDIAPGTTLIHLFHPDDMEKVYRHNGMFPSRGLVNALVKYRREKGLPDDMINAQGQEWRRLRKPAQKHLYNTKAVAAYVSVQDPICDDLVKVIRDKRDGEGAIHDTSKELNKWALEYPICDDLVKVIRDKRDGEGAIHDTSKELNKWALECIGTLMYDTRMGVMQAQLPENSLAEETFKNLMVAFEAIYKCIFFWPLHKSGKTKMWKEFVRTMDYIRTTSEKLTGKCIEKHRMGEDGLVQESLNLPLSIISDKTISDGEVLDIQTALLMGGIDTASYSTLFALYHLAKNPEKQQKLHEELTRLNPDNLPATPELLTNAKYLKAVLKENFRLNPVFPFIARLMTDDIVIRGYKIPAGTRILNHHGVASRRSEFVDAPESFQPERWLRGEKTGNSSEGRVRHPFACMPYGFGSRMCIGRRYAEQELMLVIAKLVQNFKVEYDGPALKFHSKLLYCPSTKMSFRFVDRK